MKSNSQIKAFSISVLFWGLISCDFTDSKLTITNHLTDSIAFIIPNEPNYFPAFKDQIAGVNKSVNDSLLNTYAKYDPKKEAFGGVHFLKGNSMKQILAFNTKWENIIKESNEKKLRIIFFPIYVMTSGQYKWKDIYENKMQIRERILSIEELEKINWNIELGD